MSTTNGGPSFPIPDYTCPNGQVFTGTNGMSLRDYFAAKALQNCYMDAVQVLMGKRGTHAGVDAEIAKSCYLIADAMLAERAKAKP